MDKETAIAIERLKAAQAATDKTVSEIAKDQESWNLLIKRVVFQSILWLGSLVMMGAAIGWNLPENIRKAIAEWASK